MYYFSTLYLVFIAMFVLFGNARPSENAGGYTAGRTSDEAFTGQSMDTDVDRYIETALRKYKIPGLTLAVLQQGRLIKARGYGFANLELQVPATDSTVYEIGSLTKQFTAALLMMLVQEGRLSLNDPLSVYFPNAPVSWKQITIRHLLTHTSGIRNHSAMEDFPDIYNIKHERDELLNMFYELPMDFQPGETWSYDNTGYILLGYIIEDIGGKSYWELLQERIFRPLAMKDTRNTDPRPIIPNRASGYVWNGDRFENQPTLPPYTAFSAGALQSTVLDLARWELSLSSHTLLSES
jgi:D-alanyl-D-alanine carboxypeptidase